MNKLRAAVLSIKWIGTFLLQVILIYFVFLSILTFFFNEKESLNKLAIKELLYLFSIVISSYILFQTNLYRFAFKEEFKFDRFIFKYFLVGFIISLSIICLFGIIVIYFSDVSYKLNDSVDEKGIFISTFLLFFASISEEIIFRLVLPFILYTFFKWKLIYSHILVSFLFSMVHILNPDINLMALLNVFIGGLTLSMLYLIKKNLSVPIGFHFGWNLSQYLLFGIDFGGLNFPKLAELTGSFDNKFLGNANQFESSPLLTIILLIVLLCFIKSVKNTIFSKAEMAGL